MHQFNVDISSSSIPTEDGEERLYINAEAAAQLEFFDPYRRVVFINGMKNSGHDHAMSALVLSLVQMCPVIGVLNHSSGTIRDLLQCLGDKNQFNGFSTSAQGVSAQTNGTSKEAIILKALERNKAQVSLYRVIRRYLNQRLEIFAHSQGNLILSNVLQGIEAVYGPKSTARFIVHTFGSPAVKWPTKLTVLEHGFTFDPVNWLSGLDSTFSISKVGMPAGSMNPITHGFLEYLTLDPEFFVNRFRIGSFRMTFHMDEEKLVQGLVDMGTNISRVKNIFQHLYEHHQTDVDDIAVQYVSKIKGEDKIKKAVGSDKALVQLLIKSMDEGWRSGDEQEAIKFLKSLADRSK